MAFQNRQALDMLLAEKGGVCSMFGDQCCTFIPNNTAPDGSVTKALVENPVQSNGHRFWNREPP
ncbi:Endogenous retrovirus group PABLB member 1 Env polyprotein [Merluccius polli]|uniref:Endogenous retrovirus group PABLB member 1 Env polyprotein n=1 Tax=Merluccius polli TaxID=89951 RepID=A0AA47MGE9_MERPO|nr:Endogenous retrovirus group PABLB member 1 Env polyprotein [Merluccius polli]